MKLFGREPAIWLALFSGLLQVLSAFVLPISTDMQALLGGAVAAVFGLMTAISVAQDKLLPAVVGLAQALLSLAIGFGLDWTSEQQSVLMAFVALVAGSFVRTQVVAPVPPEPARAP